MSNYYKDFRVCATCNKWGGPKRPDAFCEWVEVESGAEGFCACYRSNQKENSTCGNWQQQFD